MLRPLPVLLATVIASSSLAAQSSAHDAPHATISLVPELSPATGHSATGLAVRFEIDPGWHIYFAHPGQSGIPTRIVWKLPPGVTVDSLRWPVPERLETEGLVSHVYSGRVVLFTTLHLKREAGPLVIGASVTYGACQTQCLEGKAELQLSLAIGGPALNPEWRGFIPDYRALPARITGLSARVVRNGSALELRLSPRQAVPPATGALTFFPFDPAVLDTCVVGSPKVVGDQLVMSLGRPNPGAARLSGILAGWAGRALRVDVPIERR
ncbi:MAG: protein-disulfide reductase DsbD domain-containing protein [Gemmatimonadota bacterium]